MKSFGITGEFTVAEQLGEQISFFFRQRHSGLVKPRPIAISSDLAEPMRLALQGKTGTIIAKDYRGEDVVAAYTPVPRLGLGLVAKIDVDEIYAPFIKSGITSFSISIIILSGVGFLFFKLAAPISTRIIKSEERYRDLYDNAPDMFVSVDPQNYTILQCNKTLADNLGFSKNELIGKLVFFIYHPDCMDDAKRTFQTFLKTGFIANEELQLKRKDESKIYTILNASAVYDKNGNMRHSRTVMRDICDKKAAEEKLKLAASVFTAANEGIVITDQHATIIDVNKAFHKITGYSREEAIGKNPRILHSGRQKETFYKSMWQELAEKGSWSGEIWNRRKDGSIYPEMLTISAVTGEDGYVKNYIGLFSDITRIKRHEAELQHLAQYDALTNLPNRVLLSDRLHLAMIQAQRRNSIIAIAYIDLDGFKAVNDRYGHDAGDKLLVAAASRMTDVLREVDTLARIGGDEFVAVLLDLDSTSEAATILNRVLTALAKRFHINNLDLSISASIGVTFCPQDITLNADQLQRQADQAMYDAKLAGKNCCRFFDSEHDETRQRQYKNIKAITNALNNDEFILYYQPKVNMRTGSVIGLEALVRWQHPQQGLLGPHDFLPQIETHAISIELGNWVINKTLSQLDEWHDNGLNIAISINVGAWQLQQSDFVDSLEQHLKAHPTVTPEMLEIEIQENSALQDIERVSSVIEACKKMGISFALDDFGSGYSSLIYLKVLPIRTLKIDQSFVRNMLEYPEDQTILDGIVGLADSFGLAAIAEGVETIDHGRVLLRIGCEFGQGYAIAHPMPAENIPSWIQSWQPDPAWSSATPIGKDALPILFAEAQHRALIRDITTFIRSDNTDQPKNDIVQCPFSTWVTNLEGWCHQNTSLERSINKVHSKIHQKATDIINMKLEGKQNMALSRLEELHTLLDVFIEYMNALLEYKSTKPHNIETKPLSSENTSSIEES